MTNSIVNATYNTETGLFAVTTSSDTGVVTTQNVNLSALCMIFSLSAMEAQDEVFAAEFEKAQEQVETLTMINDCMQMFNSYIGDMDPDEDDAVYWLDGKTGTSFVDDNGNPTPSWYPYSNPVYTCEPGSDFDKWYNTFYPELVETGIVDAAGVGENGGFCYHEIDALMTNLQSAQSTVSSQNEQQMLLTNDAASKRSTILQLAQSLMQKAADAAKAAAQS